MRRIVAGAMLALSPGLFGCGINEVAPKPCEAVTIAGDKITPVSYPLGNIAVGYQEAKVIHNREQDTPGVIRKEGGKYYLDVRALPPHLGDEYTDFSNYADYNDPGAAVSIHIPESGEIGFTTGCIERSIIHDNTSFAHITLPTK